MENSRNRVLHRNESTKRELLNRPRLLTIINRLKTDFSSYKFTVYRCATKLHALQKALHTSEIPYKLVLNVLERHHLSQSDETISVRHTQLTPVIHDILYACDKLGHFTQQTAFDLEVTTGILSNFLWDVFDPNRTTPITLLEVKETFLLLCHVNSMEEMVSEFFNLAADHNKCVSRHRLESILKILTKILSFLGEASAYGPHTIPDIIEQCFAQSPGVIGINGYQFNCLWNAKSNRFMIYSNLLALVKRMKDTENLIHNTSCVSCCCPKIRGIRFKCYSCRDLSLCMKCFSVGYSSSKHSLGHRVYEVYGDDVATKKWTHYLTKLCNTLFRQKNQQRTENKSGDQASEELENKENSDISSPAAKRENKSIQCTRNSDSFAEPNTLDRSLLEKLSAIMSTLFEQKEKLEDRRQCLQQSKQHSKSISDLLNDQQHTLLTVIDQLKFILEHTQHTMLPVSSTPNRFGNRRITPATSSPLTHSIHGASINKSYLDANKSYYSVSEVSTWFHHSKQPQHNKTSQVLDSIDETSIMDTDMLNFRELLSKVKEIVDDSYSDNNDLAEATYHLETVLDSIIRNEEIKRHAS
ncbi:unnamed protein product [Hermetia illucens]|uniref:ZZ-type domain-containing protein n=1 Tax=Hermetia illucens TaxID=343691 RepID=A0A7R8UZQ5_HERIL|nr:dystrophin [Hermetia illucens]CAD7089923.1 unnamed protein product [Hermetia illucens]